MNTLQEDKLFQLLLRAKERPELLLGVKSLVALENYINGYLYACEDGCFTARWYQAFCDFVAELHGVRDAFFCLSTVIRSAGYDDFDGSDYFMTLLERFAAECGAVTEVRPVCLQEGEVRVFRVDVQRATGFMSEYVREHCEEMFGVPSCNESYTWVFKWERDHTLTCALCSDPVAVAKLAPDNGELVEEIKKLPVFQSTEKIKYTTLP